MNIILYTKTGCPWCVMMKEYLDNEDLFFEERNVTENSDFFAEMKSKSGQEKAPTLDIDGYIIADADVQDVKSYLSKENNK